MSPSRNVGAVNDRPLPRCVSPSCRVDLAAIIQRNAAENRRLVDDSQFMRMLWAGIANGFDLNPTEADLAVRKTLNRWAVNEAGRVAPSLQVRARRLLGPPQPAVVASVTRPSVASAGERSVGPELIVPSVSSGANAAGPSTCPECHPGRWGDVVPSVAGAPYRRRAR